MAYLKSVTDWIVQHPPSRDTMSSLAYNWEKVIAGLRSDLSATGDTKSPDEFLAYVQEFTGLPCIEYRVSAIEEEGFIAPVKLCGKTRNGLVPFSTLLNWANARYDTETHIWFRTGVSSGQIYPYSTDPLNFLEFHKLPNEKRGTYESSLAFYGVELEVNVKEGSSFAQVAMDVNNELSPKFVMLKHDGSIGDNGFEIVSAPATLAYHKKAWDAFFAKSAKSCKSWGSGKCGMHVHIGREAFMSPLHVGKMMAFYNSPLNKEFIVRVAGRESGFATLDADHNPLLSLILKRQLKHNKPKVLNSVFKRGDAYNRRTAVNISKAGTVEIRIFRGNVSKVGFFKNLEFVDSVVQYSKIMNYRAMNTEELALFKKRLDAGSKGQEMDIYGLPYTQYLNWLEKDTNNMYPNLKLWLHKIGDFSKYKMPKVTNKTPKDKILTDAEISAVA